jgi:mandelate racemase
MTKPVPAIRSIRARALVVPLARPVKNAFGVIDSGPLVLIDVETDQGVTGRAYIFAYARLTLKPLVHLIEEIGRELVGKPVAPYDLMKAMNAKFRLLGWQGLVGMAVSGLDMAYWDALGQIAGRPLAELLGGTPRPIKAYDSYGVVDPTADEKALRRSLEQGFRGIKIKGGDGDAANDERVVKGVRKLLGPDIALMIDFNQSLDPAEATRRIARLAPYDLHWIEEPVPQENLLGHAKVRETSPTPIQAGENWWFPRGFAEAIAAGASDFIMPDLMKCGGVTGWLQVAAQAEAAHMLAVTPTAHWLRVSRFRQCHPRPPRRNRRRHAHRARTRPRAGMERGGGGEIHRDVIAIVKRASRDSAHQAPSLHCRRRRSVRRLQNRALRRSGGPARCAGTSIAAGDRKCVLRCRVTRCRRPAPALAAAHRAARSNRRGTRSLRSWHRHRTRPTACIA